jgi:hypothetical protein
MAFTRFNYDECRTKKKLQEATGPGRYILNVPGNGPSPCFFNDPQIRMQKWGANLQSVVNGAPIDIDSDLTGRRHRLTKYCSKKRYSSENELNLIKYNYPTCKEALTDESRATHPAWQYRALPQNREYPLFFNPQENVCFQFHNNLNTRLLEKDNFVPKIPCLKKE